MYLLHVRVCTSTWLLIFTPHSSPLIPLALKTTRHKVMSEGNLSVLHVIKIITIRVQYIPVFTLRTPYISILSKKGVRIIQTWAIIPTEALKCRCHIIIKSNFLVGGTVYNRSFAIVNCPRDTFARGTVYNTTPVIWTIVFLTNIIGSGCVWVILWC